MSNLVTTINVLSLLIELAAQTQKVAQLIQTAQSQGRDVTEAELDQLKLESAAAIDRLRNAVA